MRSTTERLDKIKGYLESIPVKDLMVEEVKDKILELFILLEDLKNIKICTKKDYMVL